MNLKTATDRELQDELARREAERKSDALLARQEYFRVLVQNRDSLLALIPHGRTSCSDQDIRNGLGSAEYGARCTRCALLELTEHDAHSYDAELSLTFRPVDQK